MASEKEIRICSSESLTCKKNGIFGAMPEIPFGFGCLDFNNY